MQEEPRMTQAALAEKIGCSESHISQLETGRGVPSLAVVYDISSILQVPLDRLVRDKKDEPQIGCFLEEVRAELDSLSDYGFEIAVKLVRSVLSTAREISEMSENIHSTTSRRI